MIKINITDVKIRKLGEEGKMKAVVSITFDNMFAVHDIKVIESKDKLFVAMPSRRTHDGKYKDIAHPINAEMRNLLQEEIIEKYNHYIENQKN